MLAEGGVGYIGSGLPAQTLASDTVSVPCNKEERVISDVCLSTHTCQPQGFGGSPSGATIALL